MGVPIAGHLLPYPASLPLVLLRANYIARRTGRQNLCCSCGASRPVPGLALVPAPWGLTAPTPHQAVGTRLRICGSGSWSSHLQPQRISSLVLKDSCRQCRRPSSTSPRHYRIDSSRLHINPFILSRDLPSDKQSAFNSIRRCAIPASTSGASAEFNLRRSSIIGA